MQFFSDVGLLAIGSRLKALSDRLYDTADETYRRHGIALQARWFPVLRLLHDKGPQPVGEIAAAVGQTHSAISQLATRLTQRGMLEAVADATDGRLRRLSLTPRAVDELRAAKPYWHAIREELEARFHAAGVDAWAVLDEFANVLDGSLEDAIADRAGRQRAGAVRIVPFRPELREHFYRLNADWLRRYFYLEEVDQRVLSNPEAEILAGGGAIYFAQAGDEVVGTCALLPAGPGTYELTKMAVDPSAQGLGIGRLLLEAALADFEARGGERLFLETNTRLAAAIRLYESVGFERQAAPGTPSHYQRADTYMVWRGRPG
jgi:ribosomal protein S18 acetylase RimI-like enzyme/DNA-binding MarR family transcriptional regulator